MMSSPAFGAFRKNNEALSPAPVAHVRARVVKSPASAADLAGVEAVEDESHGRLYLGMASWPKPAGKTLPVDGDECLVAFDNLNGPWIVGWAIPNWGH